MTTDRLDRLEGLDGLDGLVRRLERLGLEPRARDLVLAEILGPPLAKRRRRALADDGLVRAAWIARSRERAAEAPPGTRPAAG